ncbi:MAG: hypothetical protein WB817_05800 [Terriglobales bacterium]
MVSSRKHPLFHFQPLHNLYALIMAMILFVLILIFMAMPAR